MRESHKRVLKAVGGLAFLGGTVALVVVGLNIALLYLVYAMVLAYLMFPLVVWLERFRIKRVVAVAGVGAVSVLFILGLTALLGKHIYDEAIAFLDKVPVSLDAVLSKGKELAVRFGIDYQIDREGIVTMVKEYAEGLSSETVEGIAQKAFSSTGSIIVVVANLYVLPLSLFYITNDYEKIVDRLYKLFPRPWLEGTTSFLRNCNQILKDYLRGRVLIAAARAVIYCVGLWLVGVDFALILGILSGVLSIIPYVGVSIGLAATSLIVLSTNAGLLTFALACTVYIFVFVLDALVLAPHLVEKKSGLSNITIMLALIIGENLFGITGVFLAIPATGIIKLVVQRIFEQYQKSGFYLGTSKK